MDQTRTGSLLLIGPRLMLAFEGTEPPPRILSWIRERHPAGFSLFPYLNTEDPVQVRSLTATLQKVAADSQIGPLLIAADQEGGQLVGLGEYTTQFPGNMALGATRDPQLAFSVGQAQGREMAALGLNVNYAPVCDINTNPDNPNVGVRAFGDDPKWVAKMAGAMIKGLQSAGVAATAKHFPGNGDSASDPHYDLPLLSHDIQRLREVEFLPFRSAIEAGGKLMMTAHAGLPALTGRHDLPATLSRKIMVDLLRRQLGFRGLLITDALDMQAITQGAGQIIDLVAAIRAGVDLLLMTRDPQVQEDSFHGLMLAHSRRLLDDEDLLVSNKRLASLQRWLASRVQPDLNVLQCAEHLQLSELVARRSLTLVRDQAGMLPLQPDAEAQIMTIMPRPADLTPADTSSTIVPALASAIRSFHPRVDEMVIPQRPASEDISAVMDRVQGSDLIVVGTISAHLQLEQAALVNQLLAGDIPVITVALRTPYDLTAYPSAATHLCTYSIQPVSMKALAAGLFGHSTMSGSLPVNLAPEFTS